MSSSQACSSQKSLIETKLVNLFAKRAGQPTSSPWQAIEDLVAGLRKSVQSNSSLFLTRCLEQRRVIESRIQQELACDGYIEPVGTRFDDGFRLVLDGKVSLTRRRFTVAHEICHTFFYELVPEIKFTPHETDPFEEKLCNYGAAALLIPAEDLIVRSKGKDPSLLMLEELSGHYGVSIEAMHNRLRGLRVWNSELSIWHCMTGGRFVLDRLHGGFKADWHWFDETILERTRQEKTDQPASGRTFVYFCHSSGESWTKPVYYQIKRRGMSLVALWSPRPFQNGTERRETLFHSHGKTCRVRRSRKLPGVSLGSRQTLRATSPR